MSFEPKDFEFSSRVSPVEIPGTSPEPGKAGEAGASSSTSTSINYSQAPPSEPSKFSDVNNASSPIFEAMEFCPDYSQEILLSSSEPPEPAASKKKTEKTQGKTKTKKTQKKAPAKSKSPVKSSSESSSAPTEISSSSLPPGMFLVERLVDFGFSTEDNHPMYKVRWVGYGKADDTWQRREILMQDIPEVVLQYEEQRKLGKNKGKKSHKKENKKTKKNIKSSKKKKQQKDDEEDDEGDEDYSESSLTLTEDSTGTIEELSEKEFLADKKKTKEKKNNETPDKQRTEHQKQTPSIQQEVQSKNLLYPKPPKADRKRPPLPAPATSPVKKPRPTDREPLKPLDPAKNLLEQQKSLMRPQAGKKNSAPLLLPQSAAQKPRPQAEKTENRLFDETRAVLSRPRSSESAAISFSTSLNVTNKEAQKKIDHAVMKTRNILEN